MILLLLGSLFIAIAVVFNLFIANYIKTDALSQLGAYSEVLREPGGNARRQSDSALPALPQQAPNRTGAKTELFIINSAYGVENSANSSDAPEIIAAYLKEHNRNLDATTGFHLKTKEREYYLSIVRDPLHSDGYAVLYVDVSSISKFTHTVNFTLFTIMLIAGAISFLVAAGIAGAVNRPVKLLRDFAKQLGDGDFSKRELCFRDREFRDLADAMNESAQQLAKYDREQKTFFQNVSHEFRTPLMSVRCYAEGLSHGVMEPVAASQVILSEAERLSEMVEDLLVLSRMDSGGEEPQKLTGDLRETFSACAERLKPVAAKQNIAFVYDFDVSPVLFTYNEKYMARALNNLLTNALRYAKTTITLSCKNEGNTIRLAVADDGPGIAREELPHLFERFYRGENGGHGIGLSIVKSVVSAAGGSVFARNENGAVFVVKFTQ